MIMMMTFDKFETFQHIHERCVVNILVTTARYFSATLGSKES